MAWPALWAVLVPSRVGTGVYWILAFTGMAAFSLFRSAQPLDGQGRGIPAPASPGLAGGPCPVSGTVVPGIHTGCCFPRNDTSVYLLLSHGHHETLFS